jgi:hypothetical protein
MVRLVMILRSNEVIDLSDVLKVCGVDAASNHYRFDVPLSFHWGDFIAEDVHLLEEAGIN